MIKRKYPIQDANVTEILFDEEDCLNENARFENINGLITTTKCLFINFDEFCSEIEIHNLDDEELEKVKEIINQL